MNETAQPNIKKLSNKERMKIPRHPMPEQDPLERAKNFFEVPLGYTTETAIEEAQRCLQCKDPKCMHGCPVNVKIPQFIFQVASGNFEIAAHILKETNALPAVCGRVCPQESQCEAKCILGKKGEPVAVGRLERFVADCELAQGEVTVPETAERVKEESWVVVPSVIVREAPSGATVVPSRTA